MNKCTDLFLCLILFILGIFIWIYKTIITSDIPINISFKQFYFFIYYHFYIYPNSIFLYKKI